MLPHFCYLLTKCLRSHGPFPSATILSHLAQVFLTFPQRTGLSRCCRGLWKVSGKHQAVCSVSGLPPSYLLLSLFLVLLVHVILLLVWISCHLWKQKGRLRLLTLERCLTVHWEEEEACLHEKCTCNASVARKQ